MRENSRMLNAEIDPDTPVSDVQFPQKETAELSFITSAPATSTQDPNKRVIFQRLEEQTNVHIDWTCFVADQFSDKKIWRWPSLEIFRMVCSTQA